MILAEKIINLRKKSGFSQEELASKLDVSRQSVSKWEGGQSIPDLDKIIKLSQIFGVSTDFLLKDEIEFEFDFVNVDAEPLEAKKVSMEMANDYIKIKNETAKYISSGVSLCILSPVLLILLVGLSEYQSILSENVACLIGIVAMLILITIAVALFLLAGNKSKEYKFIQTQAFETEYGVTGLVDQKKKGYSDNYFRGNLVGIILCILSSIPLLITAFTDNGMLCIIGLLFLLVIVSIGVFVLVYVGCKHGALTSLLQEGDYSKANKKRASVLDAISGAYWLIAVAIFLAWSFLANSWEISWIVFAIAGVLYAAIFGILYTVSYQSNKKDNNN